MGMDPQETKLIVRHTFLEIVLDAPGSAEKRNRSFTDGAITYLGRWDAEVQNVSSVDAGAQAIAQQQWNVGLVAAELARLPQENTCSNLENERQFEAVADHDLAGIPSLSTPETSNAHPSCAQWIMAGNGQQYGYSMMMPAMGSTSSPTPWLVPMFSMPGQSNATEQANAPVMPRPRESGVRPVSHFIPARQTPDEATTVMLRNLPNQYTRDMLVDLLNREGYTGKFHFVYLPIDFKTHAGLGYAFVDLASGADAESLRRHFEGFSRWSVRSEKICSVSWSHPEQQGCAAHVKRYRNSPVMHDSVPDMWKPALFSACMRVPFPVPTKRIRNPRIRLL